MMGTSYIRNLFLVCYCEHFLFSELKPITTPRTTTESYRTNHVPQVYKEDRYNYQTYDQVNNRDHISGKKSVLECSVRVVLVVFILRS